jgi:branched-chain amino acid transport system ATP-binding protein
MPIARRVLNAQDWADINRAWAENRDPLTGVETEKEYEQVLDRIVKLAPPPIGIAR